MNKFIKFILIALFCLVVFLIGKYIVVPFAHNIFIDIAEINKREYTVPARKMDTLKYVSENSSSGGEKGKVLDTMFIDIAKDFEEKNAFKPEYDNIQNFFELQPYFLEYRLYLTSKYKIEDIIKTFPDLAKKTQNMSDAELVTYFNNNKTAIEKAYGLTTEEEFKVLADSVKPIIGKSIYFIPSSIFHNASAKTIKIGAYIDDVLINFTIKPYYSNQNQNAPYVAARGVNGGVS